MDDLIRLTGMYENTSKAGQQYFVGYLGAAKVLLLKDQRAAEGRPGWALMIAPRPDRQRDQAGRQDRATDDAPPPATEDAGQANVAAPRQSRTMQVVPRDLARQGPIERSQAARADGSLPFDDEIGF